MDLEFVRGDTKKFKFKIQDKNKEILELASGDKLYFTVKVNSNSKKKIIQKTLENGIKYDNGYYVVTIESDDTGGLNYGTYGYDIQLKTPRITRTLKIGSMNLTEEYTHKGDEV